MAGVDIARLKEVMVEELEGKKVFAANNDIRCHTCGSLILEGDEFFFFGDKKKVCNDCRDTMTTIIEEQVR